MESANKDPGESQELQRRRATIYEWLGKLVIINYTRGPSWDEVEDPYEIARGALEGREAVFFLEELGELGVLVRRPLRDEGVGDPAFIPWGAIHMITSLLPESEMKKDAPESEEEAKTEQEEA